MIGVRTLSGGSGAVALNLPRIFIGVIIALEGCHCYFANRLLFLIQLSWDLRIDLTPISIMQPLHCSFVVHYTGRANIVWRN